MLGDAVWYLVYVGPWVTLGAGVAAGLVLDRPRALVLLGCALGVAAALILLVAGALAADGGRDLVELVVAAPLVGLWQLPTFALGAVVSRSIARAVRRSP